MAVDTIIVEDTVRGSRYAVRLSNGSLRLAFLPDQSTPITTDVLQDSITGVYYRFKLTDGKLTLTPASPDVDVEDIEVTANWPTVHSLSDGEDVKASTFNRPISELAERTTYLYDKLRVFSRDDPMSSVILTDARLDDSDTPSVGDVVYLNSDTKQYCKALATTDLLDVFKASGSTFAVGVLIEKGGNRGKVTLFGKIDLSVAEFDLSKMVQSDETFRDGLYYLSCTEPGKITSIPNGPRVVVGQFFSNYTVGENRGDFALVHVEAKDLAESHTHRSLPLCGLPAGEQLLSEDSPEGKHSFTGFSPEAYLVKHDEDSQDIYPRLVFTGEWLASSDCIYDFVLGGSVENAPVNTDLEFGQNPAVTLWWYNRTENTSGKIEFTGFREPKAVEYGTFVELRPSPLLTQDTENVVYRVSADSEDKRTWSGFEFPAVAVGWRDLTAEESARFANSSLKPKFVYNIGFDKALQQVYPPIPLGSLSLLLNGVELVSDTKYGKPVYSAGNDSIYWYDDSWDHAPWPVHYENRGSSYDEWEERRFCISFIRSTSAETGPVTSLRPKEGSGIRITRCGSGVNSDVGDLEIDIDPTGDVVEDEVQGYKVVKGGSGGVFRTGPVVERIVAGPGVKISRFGNSPQGQGTVVVSSVESGIRGDFEEVALQNAKQDMVGMFPYIKLLGWGSGTNIPSAFILKFHVPYNGSDNLFKVNMYASVFGLESYSSANTRYAGVQLDYNILPDLNPVEGVDGTMQSANIQDDLIKPNTPRFVEIPVVSELNGGLNSYVAYDPVLVQTEDGSGDIVGKRYSVLGEQIPAVGECGEYFTNHGGASVGSFGVKAGYTVAIRISRTGIVSGSAEYTAPIGFMNMRWELEVV